MKTLLHITALALAMAISVPVFAQESDASGEKAEQSSGDSASSEDSGDVQVATGDVLSQLEYHDPLSGQPAVRRRVLYLPKRIELTPSLGVTFLQDFRHTMTIGLKTEYHFNDYLSLGVAGHFRIYSMESGLTDEMLGTLPSTMSTNTWVDPTPSKAAMKAALDDVGWYANLYLAYTPAFGKMGIFATYFFNFDVYFMGGGAAVYLNPGNLSGYADTPDAPASGKLHIIYKDGYENGGLKYGPMAGLGIRVYINRWIAFNTEFRWMYIKRNDAGFDRTGDYVVSQVNGKPWLIVDENDEAWESLMFFHFGASLFYPRWAPRSE